MKTTIISVSRKLAFAAGFALTLGTLGAADTIVRSVWPFATDVNPASAGAATATVTPGDFSSGWVADLSMLPGGTGGYWDLGQNGTMTIHFPHQLTGAIKVKVAQWWDGMVYGGFVSVTVPGASPAQSTANIERLGSLGGWVVDETTWTPAGGASVDTIIVQSGPAGGVIDSVVVESAAAMVTPPVLSIRAQGSQVVLSWPASASTMVLEATSVVTGTPDWQAVEAQVQVADGLCSVALPADAGARFYRLKQP
jgi:hypothetical protein